MKYFFIALFAFFSFSNLKAQKLIKLEDVANHIGDSVTFTAKVYSTRFLESAKGTPTFLNLGAAFPNHLLTVVIFGEGRAKFPTAPEKLFADKVISVTGKVVLYRDKPQIVVNKPEQIQIILEKK